MDITNLSKLSKLIVEKYTYHDNHICDFHNIPRPRTCIGLILDGTADFYYNNEIISVKKGDIIFVPITSKYISKWHGKPNISYISLHFCFQSSDLFTKQTNYELQKVTIDDFKHLKDIFEFLFKNYNGKENEQLKALSYFYLFLNKIYPLLKAKEKIDIDKNIEVAVKFIDNNYQSKICISELADMCNMSESYFYSSFKKSMGVSPIVYKNNQSVQKAMYLLINSKKTIEEISYETGFCSSIYFRRIFKKIIGKSPREFKIYSAEI